MSREKPSPKPDKTVKTPENMDPPDDEFGGFKAQKLPEPTRFGDWEVKGRCSDF